MNTRTLRITLVILVPLALVGLALSAPFAVLASHPPETGAAPLRWQDELVDKLGDVGHQSSLALDSNGYPHIVYYDFTFYTLKYAEWNGTAWTLDTVDTNAGHDADINFPLRSALAVHGGVAYIVYEKFYSETQNHFLRYAFGGPGAWSFGPAIPSGGQM